MRTRTLLSLGIDDMGTEEHSLHIAVLPWLGFGHLIPCLHLSVALAALGLRISFLSTPKNIRRLPQIPSHLTSRITFVEFPLPSVPNLPPHAESTADIPIHQSPLLKIAFDLLRTPIKNFISQSSPLPLDALIYDFAASWAGTLARECGARPIAFSTFPALALAFIGPVGTLITEEERNRLWPTPQALTSKPDWIPFPSNVAFRLREAEGFHSVVMSSNVSGTSDIDRVRASIEGCDAVIVRSCGEFEGEYLNLLHKFYSKPVIPIGLLPPAMPLNDKISGNDDNTWRSAFGWLAEQKPRSVVFVSFGSEYKFSKDEVHELAHGLEISNVPFLWALRTPAWLDGGGVEGAMPEGFVERTKGRGVVSIGWAPQLEILAHPAIGGSLFHCGLSSIIETLRWGHALVLLPLVFDQGLNARFLVEKGWGVEVERNEDGSFGREEIAKALRTAMAVSEDGEELRIRTREIGAKLGDQTLHDEYMRRFVDYLVESCKKSTD